MVIEVTRGVYFLAVRRRARILKERTDNHKVLPSGVMSLSFRSYFEI